MIPTLGGSSAGGDREY